LSGINLNNLSRWLPGDWLMALIFLAVAVVYGLAMGRNRLTIVMLGCYFSYILTLAIPWKEMAFLGVKSAPSSTAQIFIFFVLLLGFYFMLPHSAFSSALRLRGRRSSSWWQAMVFSILQVGLILQMAISFLSVKATASLSSLAQTIFVGQAAQFVWLLLPILAMMFLKGRRHYDVSE